MGCGRPGGPAGESGTRVAAGDGGADRARPCPIRALGSAVAWDTLAENMAPHRRPSVKLRAALTTAAYEQRIGPRARELMTELASFREFLEGPSSAPAERA